MQHSNPARTRQCIQTLLLAVLILPVGCGSGTYEKRLAETSQFYNYLENFNKNLSPQVWSRSGMSLRAPLPFHSPVPPAAPPAEEEEEDAANNDEEEFSDEEEALPEVVELKLDLPGLADAWKAELKSPRGDGETLFMYVVSNHGRFQDEEQGLDPLKFHDDLEEFLSSRLNTPIRPGEGRQDDDNIRFRHMVPPTGSYGAQFSQPKEYTAIRFVPDSLTDGHDVQVLLYERKKAGDVQAAIVFVTPKNLPLQLRQRIDLSLQTFDVDPQAARKRAGSSSGSGQTPASRPSF